MMRIVMDVIKALNAMYGTAFLIVEHDIGIAEISSHAYVMRLGEFVISGGDPMSLLHDECLERAYGG
jgi:branched-chain amino acid transport system ATP-binding protein